MAFAMALGEFVSTVVMIVLYYTLVAVFALPYRLFGRSLLKAQSSSSNWITRSHTPTVLADFTQE